MTNVLRSILLCGAAALTLALASGCGSDDPVTPGTGGNGDTYVKYNEGDKFTYDRYTRDASNQKDPASKETVVWTVLKANQTIGGRSGVSVVVEQAYMTDGTTPNGDADTLYFQSATDGKLYQYNLLRSVVKRIPGAQIFVDSVPPRWIQISDTKSSSAGSWVALDGGLVRDTISLLGTSLAIDFNMLASHKGTQAITVPKGSYTNSVHTDHSVIIGIASQLVNSRDTLTLGYDVSPTDGIVHQSLGSKSINVVSAQQVPGFDLELKSVARKQ
jgi:hypothetical protein